MPVAHHVPPTTATRLEPEGLRLERRRSVPRASPTTAPRADAGHLTDIQTLRTEHHICGILSGTLPQVSQQNTFLGLPLVLLPEEVVLLVKNSAAALPRHRGRPANPSRLQTSPRLSTTIEPTSPQPPTRRRRTTRHDKAPSQPSSARRSRSKPPSASRQRQSSKTPSRNAPPSAHRSRSSCPSSPRARRRRARLRR